MSDQSMWSSNKERRARRQGDHTQPKLSENALAELDCVRTIRVTAQIIGVAEVSLRNLIARGEGPRVTRLSARRIGVLDSDRRSWIAARQEPATA
jgi:predicted DNA-binding transcriptional regulator AlpA